MQINHTKFKKASAVAITSAAIVCSAAWIAYFLNVPASPGPTRISDYAYVAGDTIPTFTGVPTNRGQWLLLFVASECESCKANMPFMKSLLTLRDEANGQLPLRVVSFSDSRERLNEYLGLHGLAPDSAHVIDYKETKGKVRRVPLLLLVDEANRVQRSWIGALGVSRQKEVRQAIEAAFRPI